LSWLQGRLPVPETIEWFQNDEFDYLLVTGLDGKMLCDDEYLRNPELAVSLLAEGINMIRSLDIGGCPIHNGTDKKLKDAQKNIERGSVDMDDWEDDNSFSSPEELLQHLRSNIPRNMETAFTHGDYCLPNILAKDGKITGFIDSGRAGVADPWQDVALCIRSLWYNFGTVRFDKPLLEKTGIPMNRGKLEYHILLDELF
jgi:kanamycin kinase/aminoglycoside 3'-phosphotransferase-3